MLVIPETEITPALALANNQSQPAPAQPVARPMSEIAEGRRTQGVGGELGFARSVIVEMRGDYGNEGAIPPPPLLASDISTTKLYGDTKLSIR